MDKFHLIDPDKIDSLINEGLRLAFAGRSTKPNSTAALPRIRAIARVEINRLICSYLADIEEGIIT